MFIVAVFIAFPYRPSRYAVYNSESLLSALSSAAAKLKLGSRAINFSAASFIRAKAVRRGVSDLLRTVFLGHVKSDLLEES